MHSNEREHQQRKAVVDKALSLDSLDVAQSHNDENLPVLENIDPRERLEINIIDSTEEFQEIEIIYGDKKKRKRITKFLPRNFANIVYPVNSTPSMKMGALNLDNLSGLQNSNFFLQEKFLRILSKINQVSELKTPEKIWDSNERINTTEKAILVAVMNSHLEGSKVDRVIVSMRSNEIPNQQSFKNFISEVLDLTKNPQKLAQVLFGDAAQKLPDEKKSGLASCLNGIINETDETRRAHQMKFLQKIVGEDGRENTRGSSV